MSGAPPGGLLARRSLGVALSAAAVIALGLSLATSWWWTHRIHHDTRIDVGPWSGQVCVGEYSRRYLGDAHSPPAGKGPGNIGCATRRLGEIVAGLAADRDDFIIDDIWGPSGGEQPPLGFTLVGVLVMVFGLAALLALAVGAVAAATGRRGHGWRSLAWGAAFASSSFLALAVLLVVAAPDEIDQMSLDLGFALAMVGGALGVAAGRILTVADGDGTPDWRALDPTAGSRPAVLLTGAGVVAVLISLHARIWWVEDDSNVRASHGVRDGAICEGEADRPCEIETWNSQPRGATGERPRSAWLAFRASEATYLFGHLAIASGILLLALLARGHLVGGRWAPHRIQIAAAIGFLVAAGLLAAGDRPDSMADEAGRSIGPVLALVGALLLVSGGVATSRLFTAPIPPARIRGARLG
jgi:hypothetical protein